MPHSLTSHRLVAPQPQPDTYTRRYGPYSKGTRLPETTAQVSPRCKVSEFHPGFLKQNHIDALEQNQKISSCCRHPENHEVEALKSHPEEPVPDIYIFHCTCGRKHRFFCVGTGDTRPEWK